MGVTLYANFRKNTNSTMLPYYDGVVKNYVPGSFKEGFPLIAPHVEMPASVLKNPAAYNYLSVDLNLDNVNTKTYYYFIRDWEFSGGMWVAHCEEDVLASWQAQIFGGTYYVLRAANAYNGYIQDNSYPTKTYPEIKTVELEVLTPGGIKYNIPHTYDGGCYVVGIINHDNNSVGCVSYYQFDSRGFREFCATLMNSATWMYDGITEISEQLMKTYVNPFQYITTCMWMPVPMFKDPTKIPITYAWWGMQATCNRITAGNLEYDFFINGQLPPHPDAATRGKYLNAAPYYQAVFEWAPLGVFPINMTDNCAADRTTCHIYVDMVSGKGTYSIKAWDDETNAYSIIGQGSCMLGVQIQIAQNLMEGAQVVGALTPYSGPKSMQLSGFVKQSATTAAALTGKIAHGILSSIGGLFGIGGTADASGDKIQSMNVNGTICGYNLKPTMTVYIYRPVEEDNERRGRPLCEKRMLSTLAAPAKERGGFVVCGDAVFSAVGARTEECDQITQFLNSGIFLEHS